MKKLLTKDQILIKEVEDVLTSKGVRFVKYTPNKEREITIVAVLNRNGNVLREAVLEKGKNKKYYLGVLRKHPEYATPKDLIDSLISEIY